MATTAKTLETPATGSNQNVWGSAVLNPNFVKIDSAFGGTQDVALTNSNVTLSSSEALNVFISCTGTLSADVQLIFPARGSFYIVRNGCTGAHTLTAITAASGDSVVIPQGASALVYTDGTDMFLADGLAANGQMIYAVDTGAADAYVVDPPLAIPLTAGATVYWTPLNANTGACAIEVSGNPSTAIKTVASADPVAGAIVPSAVYASTYNGTAWITSGLGAANFGLYSADAGSGVGPTHELYRNSATPAAADSTGSISWAFKDSGGTKTTGATITGVIQDPTDTSEDYSMVISAMTAGTLAREMEIGDGIEVGSPTGNNKGAGTLNAVTLYENGARATRPLLATVTAAGDPAVNFTDTDSTLYAGYEIDIENWVQATDNQPLQFEVSIDGGATYITTSTYDFARGVAQSPSTSAGAGTIGNATILLATALGNTEAQSLSGSYKVLIGGAVAAGAKIFGMATYTATGGASVITQFSGGHNTTASQVDAFRLRPGSGNITSAVVRFYGIPK